MVDRPNKPSALASTPGLPPQAQVTISHGSDRVSASLPSGESVEILLYGATVISWKDKTGAEKLWLSEAAKLDGSKAIRGGIPIVFPVFGAPPENHVTSKLAQHGLARTSRWEFLGKSTSEGAAASGGSSSRAGGDQGVKLDFMLSSGSLDEKTRALWPYNFGLLYSVTLAQDSLTTGLVITNDDDKPFDVQMLLHTYLRVKDITKVTIAGLDGAAYVDKVDAAKVKNQEKAVTITQETDRVYSPSGPPSEPIAVFESGKTSYSIIRDNLNEVVVWNPWTEKAASMADFAPKDGFKTMICVEAGSVKGWQTLEPGDVFEGAQTINIS